MAVSAKRLEVFEILEKVSKAQTKDERVKLLKTHECISLRDLLRGTYDDAIQWNLPEGEPPYTPNRPESVPSTLHRVHRNFKYFVKGLRESENLNKIRREAMFIEMLEAVHPEDAKLLLCMINKKKLPVKGLTKKLVQEVFPNLILK